MKRIKEVQIAMKGAFGPGLEETNIAKQLVSLIFCSIIKFHAGTKHDKISKIANTTALAEHYSEMLQN